MRLRFCILLFLIAGGILSVLGLLGTNWVGKFRTLEPIIEQLPKTIRGVRGAEEGFQPNAVAGSLVLFVPLQIALLLKGRSLLQHFASTWVSPSLISIQVALLALTSTTLLLTQSRGAAGGLLIATLVTLTWLGRRVRWITIVAVATFIASAGAVGVREVLELAVSQAGPSMAGNLAGRLELWSRAVLAIEDSPVTGMGMNTFRDVMSAIYPMFLTAPNVDVAHAHNHLLQAALDLGVPGLIAYVAVWLGAAVLLIRVYLRSTDPLWRATASGLGTGLIAHFVFSLTDAIPLGAKVGVLFWLTLAVVVSLHQVAIPIPTRDAISCGEGACP